MKNYFIVIALFICCLFISCPMKHIEPVSNQTALVQTSPTSYEKRITVKETVSAIPGAMITVKKVNTYHRVLHRDTARLNTFRDSVNGFVAVLVNDSTLEVVKITVDSMTLSLKGDVVEVNTHDTATKVVAIEGVVLRHKRNWFLRNSFWLGLGSGIVISSLIIFR